MVKSEKINVLHLLSSFPIGGIEQLIIDILKENNANPESTACYTVAIMNEDIDENLKQHLLSTRAKVYFLDRKEGHKHPKYLLKLLKIIKEHRINVIHSHNPGAKSWSILCKLINRGLCLVYTVHDTGCLSRQSKLNTLAHRIFTDMNIAISKAVLQECNLNKISKSSQIYNGIELKRFNKKIQHMKDPNTLKIINVARIDNSKKGQDILIKALKKCKDKGLKFKCNFVGGADPQNIDQLEYLKNLVSELDLQQEIYFLGNRDDVPDLLFQSDLFVLPSRYEGLGNVILEAMITGIPVIATNIDGPSELIKNEKNGLLFEKGDHNELANKIMYLSGNPETMKYLAQNAYEFAKQFDISVMCRNYESLYSKLLRE